MLVVLAEMGDKTQLLAMTFAAKHNASKVLLGIFLGIVADFAITVALGQFLTTVMPMDLISLAASLSFIGFGLWSLRPEKIKLEQERQSRFGVVATVAIAFFIAELGDKTQLATISLAAQYQNGLSVFVGAVLAMLVADGVGILVGAIFCQRIPRRFFKWFSAVIFIVFGLLGICEALPSKIGMANTVIVMLVLSAVSVSAAYAVVRKQKAEASERLQVYRESEKNWLK